MKKNCLSTLLFVLITLNIYAQKSETKELLPIDTTKWLCTYNYEFLQDSSNQYSLKSDQMVLHIGSHFSKFICLINVITDSILYLNQDRNLDPHLLMNMYSNSVSGMRGSLMSLYTIYKNYPGNGMMILIDYDDHKFYKVEQPMKMNWKLNTQKDTVILGYTCLKAYVSYAGRNWVAWYSPQIPLSDGPYKFNGLPGLILKISDTKKQHCFTLNSIKKVTYNQPITLQSVSFVDITAEDYNKIMKNKMVRIYGNLQSGRITGNSEEAKSAVMHRLKTINNFIEKF